MKLAAAAGGFAGACALTLINQVIAKLDKKAPRLDLRGMNAVAKFVKNPKGAPDIVQKLLPMSVAGDLISNTLYYGLAGGGSRQKILVKGALLGLGAGLGAVALPRPMGLDETPTNLTPKTQALTVLYYVIGGLVAAATINAIQENEEEANMKKARPVRQKKVAYAV
jgi:hypothetical protein